MCSSKHGTQDPRYCKEREQTRQEGTTSQQRQGEAATPDGSGSCFGGHSPAGGGVHLPGH